MEYIDDLSCASIYNIVKGGEGEAGGLLWHMAEELETLKELIERKEEELNDMKNRKKELIQAGKNVATYLGKRLPLAVIKDKSLVVLTETGLTIENNTIKT